MSSVRTHPVTQPYTAVAPARALTEPVPGGFMRSVMHHRDTDDGYAEGIVLSGTPPEKKITQEEQDTIDEKARKRAMKNLVNSWQERLQLISVITTFFASTEAAMLVNTKPVNNGDFENNVLKASNAAFLGALIMHVYAAVLSFLGAFLLIRYKLKEATRAELLAEGLVHSPLSGSVFKDVEQVHHDIALQVYANDNGQDIAASASPGESKRKISLPVEPPIFSTNPHLEQVGLFRSKVSSHLLSRTHALCVCLAVIGFVLAIIGILCYSWAIQPLAVSVFASTCLGGAALVMAVLLI